MPLHKHETDSGTDQLHVRPQFAQLGEISEVPKLRLAPGGMPESTAYEIVHDELLLDGNARLNLATFVTTWMERDAENLMAECSSKNMIDKDEYPQTAELERRCVNILADLWHAAEEGGATGCSTTGSSEACMLGGLALKWRWRQRRQAAGKSVDRPNLVMGANVQVCWEKFCRYWDVEPRLVPVGPSATCLTARGGGFALRREHHRRRRRVGLHLRRRLRARGGDRRRSRRPCRLRWCGRAHPCGRGVGWVHRALPRPRIGMGLPTGARPFHQHLGPQVRARVPGRGVDHLARPAALPDELVFDVDYLGGSMPTFALNFSRPGAQVVAQYYNFLRLGAHGYRQVQQASRETARWLAREIAELAPFELVSDGSGIPAFAFRIGDAPYNVYDVSAALRVRGWLVPAYTMPPALEHVAVLRIVVRNGFSRDLASLLLEDLKRVDERLRTDDPATPHVNFHH